MAPNKSNDLLDHRLTEEEKKLAALHDLVHDPEKGMLKRLSEVEDVAEDVKAVKSYAQKTGLAGLGALALYYYDVIKAALPKMGGP